MGVFFFIIIIVGLVTFGEVASKWIEQGSARQALDPAREDEVSRLSEQVSLLADQVDRLSEEQRFMTRLLEAGPPSRTPPRAGESRSAHVADPRPEDPI